MIRAIFLMSGAGYFAQCARRLVLTCLSDISKRNHTNESFVSVDDRQSTIKLARVNLTALIQSTVKDMSLTHPNRLYTDLLVNVHSNIDADAIRRALENLISNALEYGSTSEKISVSMTVNQCSIDIKVHNSGNPISDIIHAHSGSVSLQSSENSGTIFTISLPFISQGGSSTQH